MAGIAAVSGIAQIDIPATPAIPDTPDPSAPVLLAAVAATMEPMRKARRHDLSPRVELTPLIDVIFLLLTFFIYSLVVMVRAEVLPVELVPVSAGQSAEPTAIEAITIDRSGELYLNREPITLAALDVRLAELAAAEDPPRLFVAMEATAEGQAVAEAAVVDRGPLLIELIERVRQAGIENFHVVGPAGG